MLEVKAEAGRRAPSANSVSAGARFVQERACLSLRSFWRLPEGNDLDTKSGNVYFIIHIVNMPK